MSPRMKIIILILLLLLPLFIAYRQFSFHRYELMIFWLALEDYIIYSLLKDKS